MLQNDIEVERIKFIVIMTQEEKSLLFKDLCTRLPHHVRVKVWLKDGTTEEGFLDLEHNYADVLQDAFYYNKIKDIKPYLRPMSSMTEEEDAIFNNISNKDRGYEEDEDGWIRCDSIHTKWGVCPDGCAKLLDYLNSIHIDYRGLIEKGLAVKVTAENNPYK